MHKLWKNIIVKAHTIQNQCTCCAICETRIIARACDDAGPRWMFQCDWRADASRGCEGRKTGLVVAAKKGPGPVLYDALVRARFSWCSLSLSLYIGDAMCFLFVYLRYVRAAAQRAPAALQMWRALENKTKTAARQIMHTGRACMCMIDTLLQMNVCALEGKTPLRGCSLEYLARAAHYTLDETHIMHNWCPCDAACSSLLCVCVPCRKVICIFSHSSAKEASFWSN